MHSRWKVLDGCIVCFYMFTISPSSDALAFRRSMSDADRTLWGHRTSCNSACFRQIRYSWDSHVRSSDISSWVANQRSWIIILLPLSYPIDAVVAVVIQGNKIYPCPSIQESAYARPCNTRQHVSISFLDFLLLQKGTVTALHQISFPTIRKHTDIQ